MSKKHVDADDDMLLALVRHAESAIMEPQSRWASEQLERLVLARDRLMQAIESLGPQGLELRIRDGWTVKEMLAHLAFWEETSVPVVENIFRGRPEIPASTWYGGADLELAPGDPWPDADTHNAREARWAREHSDSDVRERWQQAREQLTAVVASVTAEESAAEIGDHLAGIFRHTEQHVDELEAMAPR